MPTPSTRAMRAAMLILRGGWEVGWLHASYRWERIRGVRPEPRVPRVWDVRKRLSQRNAFLGFVKRAMVLSFKQRWVHFSWAIAIGDFRLLEHR